MVSANHKYKQIASLVSFIMREKINYCNEHTIEEFFSGNLLGKGRRDHEKNKELNLNLNTFMQFTELMQTLYYPVEVTWVEIYEPQKFIQQGRLNFNSLINFLEKEACRIKQTNYKNLNVDLSKHLIRNIC